jgi:hypothetical protein
MHQHYAKDVLLCEVNTDYADRVEWLSDLRTWLSTAQADWCEGMVLSQDSSRAQLQYALVGTTVGDMNWRVAQDSTARQIIKALIRDIT